MYLEQLLVSDDVMYRAAQAITVIHARRSEGSWLRIIGLDGNPTELLAIRGERLLRPSSSIGLHTELGHTQHLHTRCASPLGADPTNLQMLTDSGRAHELQHGAETPVSTATWGLAGALDDLHRARQRPTRKLRLWRAPATPTANEEQEKVAAWTAQLRAAMQALEFTQLRSVSLGWDDVTEDMGDMQASA
ncbi:hypothetical protein [Deinococcus knuensis]|uniref:Uncharacterized protein n=1 Tax=Deinococcus knuensis TaxID=1837380 RepID=A0ABQ2SR19_9DEIO|nr:hypothetical protein [Deinococcus knuensis]GGS37375.1 hypothetical protein GCM10008961_31180 [Deinococcus knuensis]